MCSINLVKIIKWIGRSVKFSMDPGWQKITLYLYRLFYSYSKKKLILTIVLYLPGQWHLPVPHTRRLTLSPRRRALSNVLHSSRLPTDDINHPPRLIYTPARMIGDSPQLFRILTFQFLKHQLFYFIFYFKRNQSLLWYFHFLICNIVHRGEYV